MGNNLRLFSSLRSQITSKYYRAMSSGSAGAYVVTVSTPASLGPVPETASEKNHWVLDEAGKGEVKRFVNPWDSAHDFTFPEIFKAMMQSVLAPILTQAGLFPRTLYWLEKVRVKLTWA
jgi:hypothetical protein